MKKVEVKLGVKKEIGRMPDGRVVEAYTLRRSSEFQAEIWTLGGAVNRIVTPDRNGVLADVVLGFDSVEDRLAYSDYQGELVGRFANRIADGRFTLGGTRYQLPCNNPEGCLHGAGEFSRTVWQVQSATETALTLMRYSHRNSCGFPGAVTATVTYRLIEPFGLELEFSAVSDADTLMNMTNHAYFNLKGYDGGEVLNHELRIAADRYLPLDQRNLPTGEMRSVAGTPFDFRQAKPVGLDLLGDEDLQKRSGYDHNFCLNGKGLREVAWVKEPTSGRTLTVVTDQPGMQLYLGNCLKGMPGKQGIPMTAYTGFCTETQGYPDAPNHADFPSCVLKAGERYHTITRFCFGAE